MTYIVHINPIPGTDSKREVEVEAAGAHQGNGAIIFLDTAGVAVAFFAPGVWIYVEPKK